MTADPAKGVTHNPSLEKTSFDERRHITT